MRGQAIWARVGARLAEKKGFTLLEVMLATALVSVLFALSAFVVPVWYRAYQHTIELSHARQIADSVISGIEQQIQFANKVSLVTLPGESIERLTGVSGRSSSEFYIPMKESTDFIDGLVYDEKYFMNHGLELSFVMDGADASYCEVTVKITREDGGVPETVLTKTRAVELFGKNG